MNRHPLTIDGCVEVAVVERSGFDESRHYGAGVVVDADGSIIRSVGDPGASVYPRSTMKPFQALATRRSGARFDDAQYVLTTASHAGTARHQEAVTAMLSDFGNTPEDLGCPPAFPLDSETARGGAAQSRVAMECSGKHAGMLAACRVNGWSLSSYLDWSHPMQQAVRAEVEEACDEKVDVVGADGCGTPVFPLTLGALARGMARIVTSTDGAERELTTAVLQNPWAIDGVGRVNAITIETLQVFAKLGTEGMMLIGVPGKAGVAVKILDGSLRAATLTALSLLAGAGLIESDRTAAVIDAVTPQILSRGQRVGRIRLGDGLQ